MPLLYKNKYSHEGSLLCCGVISATRGAVLWHLSNKSLDSEAFKVILLEIREAIGPDAKVCLALDNATYHKSGSVLKLAASEEVNIQLLFNIPSRPDILTVGIERVWAVAKKLYRDDVDRHRGLNR